MAAAGAADSDPTAVATSTCAHCQRDIPSSNMDLHSAHCARNLQKCEHCREMVARKLMDEHYNENHTPVMGALFQQCPGLVNLGPSGYISSSETNIYYLTNNR